MTNKEAQLTLANLKRYISGGGAVDRGTNNAIDMAIEALSKPEIVMCNDCISRRAAIDALRTCYDTETITMDNGDEYINYGDAVGEIEQLPPIQSKLLQPWEVLAAQSVLSQPAEPKKGKWIDANICGELPVIVCDQCHTFFPIAFGDFHNFCPNCGAKMEGAK